MIEISRGTALERKVWRFHCSWDSGYGSTPKPILMGIIYFSPLTIAGESDTLFSSTRELRK